MPGQLRLFQADSKQLTGKLWNTHHAPEDVEKQLDISLKDLRTSYLDLYLVRLLDLPRHLVTDNIRSIGRLHSVARMTKSGFQLIQPLSA